MSSWLCSPLKVGSVCSLDLDDDDDDEEEEDDDIGDSMIISKARHVVDDSEERVMNIL